jgi:hypothetical protein
MTTDPGVPTPDVLALGRFEDVLYEATAGAGGEQTAGDVISALRDAFPSAQFVQDVNSVGVAVRRLVIHGEWEVDPNPPTHPEVRTGDRVAYRDPSFDFYDDWEVRAVPFQAADPADSLVLLARPEWGPDLFVNTTARWVRIVSRPAGGSDPAPDRTSTALLASALEGEPMAVISRTTANYVENLLRDVAATGRVPVWARDRLNKVEAASVELGKAVGKSDAAARGNA